MNQYMALVVASLCLLQPVAYGALNTYQAANIMRNDAMRFNSAPFLSGPNPVALMSTQLRAQKSIESGLTLDGFTKATIQALAPLPFFGRDTVAQLIQFSDGLYGNIEVITGVVNAVITMANIFLSAVPFGALIPMLIQIAMNLALGPQTRFYVQFLMFKVWQMLPPTPGEQWQVRVDQVHKLVIVEKAGTPVPTTLAPPTDAPVTDAPAV